MISLVLILTYLKVRLLLFPCFTNHVLKTSLIFFARAFVDRTGFQTYYKVQLGSNFIDDVSVRMLIVYLEVAVIKLRVSVNCFPFIVMELELGL